MPIRLTSSTIRTVISTIAAIILIVGMLIGSGTRENAVAATGPVKCQHKSCSSVGCGGGEKDCLEYLCCRTEDLPCWIGGGMEFWTIQCTDVWDGS